MLRQNHIHSCHVSYNSQSVMYLPSTCTFEVISHVTADDTSMLSVVVVEEHTTGCPTSDDGVDKGEGFFSCKRLLSKVTVGRPCIIKSAGPIAENITRL